MAPIDIKETIGLSKFNIGGSVLMNVVIVLFITFIIFACVAALIWFRVNSKKYKYRIPLYTKVGNVTTRINTLKAKEVPMGRAGDKLWFAKGKGIKKWLVPPNIQTAKNEFWHYIRADGEWVNFSMEDLDEKSIKAGVKYVAQSMRLQRLATDRLLEQRLLQKGFLEKFGLVIGYVIFFLVITISLVVFFHQFSEAAELLNKAINAATDMVTRANALERAAQGKAPIGTGIVPVSAILPLIWFGGKTWRL